MPDIFLSYSRDDQATARRFAEAFERAGFSVWWDQTLNAGEAYDEVTERALEEARAVVVLWSKKSVASRWVRAEATQADRSGTLVPAMIEDCKRPIMFELTQTADLSNWSGNPDDKTWQGYLASVRRFVEKSGTGSGATPPTPSPPVPGRSRRISPAVVAIGAAALLVAGAVLWGLNRSSNDTTAQPATAAANAPGAAATDVSLAVLPFLNMSSDPEQEYFSDGLSEELLNQLSKVPDLRVIGRTSSFAFKGQDADPRRIGETLGVNHILEGNVRKAGNQVRITAKLINPVDGSQLWSDTYDRSLDDIFAIQEEIARTVVGQLQLRMGTGGGSGTNNVAAFEEFLAGRALLSSNSGVSMRASVPRLERAVTLDPAFVPAWLWLVDAYTRVALGDATQRQSALRRQDEAIDRVVALAPGSPEASFALSYRAARGSDLRSLDRLLQESLKLTGSQGVRARLRYGQFLTSVGQVKRAIEELERVRRDDPLDVFARNQLLLAFEVSEDYARADAEMRQILELPGASNSALLGTAVTRAQGRRDLAKLDKALEALPQEGGGVPMAAGQLRSLLNAPVAARRELRRIFGERQNQDDIYGYSGMIQWAAWFGDRDLALQALEVLRQQQFNFETWGWIIWRPVMRDVRTEPGFKALVKDMGLVDYWRASGDWGEFCKPVDKDDFACQ
jgi:TolB-like protein/tetratricopeptide (TPR) repeat protein